MAKTKTAFICQSCGAKSPRWVGKCPVCDAWSTMVEEKRRRNIRPSEVNQ